LFDVFLDIKLNVQLAEGRQEERPLLEEDLAEGFLGVFRKRFLVTGYRANVGPVEYVGMDFLG